MKSLTYLFDDYLGTSNAPLFGETFYSNGFWYESSSGMISSDSLEILLFFDLYSDYGLFFILFKRETPYVGS